MLRRIPCFSMLIMASIVYAGDFQGSYSQNDGTFGTFRGQYDDRPRCASMWEMYKTAEALGNAQRDPLADGLTRAVKGFEAGMNSAQEHRYRMEEIRAWKEVLASPAPAVPVAASVDPSGIPDDTELRTIKAERNLYKFELETRSKFSDFDDVITLAADMMKNYKELFKDKPKECAQVKEYLATCDKVTASLYKDDCPNIATLLYFLGQMHPSYKKSQSTAQIPSTEIDLSDFPDDPAYTADQSDKASE